MSDIFLASLIGHCLYPKDVYSSIFPIANCASTKPRIRASIQRHTWAMLSFPLGRARSRQVYANHGIICGTRGICLKWKRDPCSKPRLGYTA